MRDVQKGGGTGPKTPVCIIDIGGGGTEALLAAGQATMANSVPVVIASDQAAVATKLADGVDVTQGALADVAVTNPASSGSIIALLKGILTSVLNLLPKGQATMANSSPVTIASNQSNLPANITQVGGSALALGAAAKAASIPVNVASDQNVPTIPVLTSQSATLNAVSSSVNGSSVATNGYQTAVFQVTGTFVASFSFQGSPDGGTTWQALSAMQRGSLGNAVVTIGSAPGTWLADVSGFTHVRGVSVWTSGTSLTMQVAFVSDPFTPPISAQDSSGNQIVVGNIASGSSDSGNPVKVGGVGNSTAPTAVSSGQRQNQWLGLNGGTVVSLSGTSISADNISNGPTYFSLATNNGVGLAPVHGMNFNGTNYDRQRNNNDLTALASAARTATTSSADQTNYNNRGLLVFLNVTVASGTGGLVLTIQGKDPVSGSYVNLNANPTGVTATGLTVYELYPGDGAVSGGVTQRTSAPLPRTFRVTVTAGDSSSYTYSVGYSLIL